MCCLTVYYRVLNEVTKLLFECKLSRQLLGTIVRVMHDSRSCYEESRANDILVLGCKVLRAAINLVLA